MMVGRDVLLRVDKAAPSAAAAAAEPLLSVDDLHVLDDRNLEAVRGVSFNVRGGEIVGLAGVDGNGQSEVIDAISGLRRVSSGSVKIAGRDVTGAQPSAILDLGLGHIPEDRQLRGLVLEFSLAENLALHDFDK